MDLKTSLAKKLSNHTCQCDYCKSIELNNQSSSLINTKSAINVTTNKSTRRSRSLEPILSASKCSGCRLSMALEAGGGKGVDMGLAIIDDFNLGLHYYNSWKSEKFKSSALEKENEKLEIRLKSLQSKLEKEILQQIKISLEWRQTVTNLVDENTRLKKLLLIASTSSSSSSPPPRSLLNLT